MSHHWPFRQQMECIHTNRKLSEERSPLISWYNWNQMLHVYVHHLVALRDKLWMKSFFFPWRTLTRATQILLHVKNNKTWLKSFLYWFSQRVSGHPVKSRRNNFFFDIRMLMAVSLIFYYFQKSIIFMNEYSYKMSTFKRITDEDDLP